MDQQTDDQHTALNAAALNPAHIPGLMPAPAAAPQAPTDRPTAAEPEPETAQAADDTADGSAAKTVPAPAPAPDAEAAGPAPERPEADEAEDGPTFLASDRRGSITADRSGIRLRLDDEQAEFSWDELSAVEYASSRWTRRFTITVHLPRPRWFRTDVQAEDRAALALWSEQLEEVLNAYFEE